MSEQTEMVIETGPMRTLPREPDPALAMIERAASNPKINVEKLERLMAMRNDIIEREAKQAFATAMHRAQSEIRMVTTNKDNAQTQSRYADLAKIDVMIRPIYTKHGFSMTFGTEVSADAAIVNVCCDVLHVGGAEKRYRIPMPADGKGPKGGDVMTRTHATGSAITYGRRYLHAAIWNIPVGDDDGNRAGARQQYLTEEQGLEIHALLNDNDLNVDDFLIRAGYAAIADIPARAFQPTKDRIMRAAKAKADRKAGAAQ